MTVTTVPGFYTLEQATQVLGPGAPSVTTLRKEITEGRLHAKRIGRCLRVTDVELTRWALDTQIAPGSAVTAASATADPAPLGSSGSGAIS